MKSPTPLAPTASATSASALTPSTASAAGFQKYTKTGIVVNVAQTLEEDVSFKVGSATQTVSVQAEALQTQTETSEVSTLISGQQVEELSTNGNNVTALAALGLGVSNNLPSFSGVDALTSANGISFNGTRTTHNIYLLDGAEQNDRGCGGCFMNLPSQESIAEFQTLDSNYQPDYGIGSGGTILLVLKSGTHDFHGELYEFNRNTDYNANDYFVKKSGKAARPSSSTSPAATLAARSSFPASTTTTATAPSSSGTKSGAASSRAARPRSSTPFPPTISPPRAHRSLTPPSTARLRPLFPRPPIPPNWLSTRRMA